MSATSSLSSSFGTLDVNTLVNNLMSVERNPQVLLNNRKLQIQNKATALKDVATDVKALMSAASALTDAGKWQPIKTSSSSSAVTAMGTSGALTGSLAFKVAQMAAKQKIYGAVAVSSTATAVAPPGRFLLAAGMGPMGFETLTDAAGLALGGHTVSVTQASAAAAKAGDNVLTGITLTGAGTDNTLDIELNGATYTLNLASGTYAGPQELLDAVKLAAHSATDAGLGTVDLSGQLSASLDGGKLTLATTREGSAASIQVMGTSTALAALGLSADASATTGVNAKVTVDDHVNEISLIEAGTDINLLSQDGGATAITASLTGGLRTGSATVQNVDLEDGSLANVVTAINGAFGSVAAAAIKVGDNQYRFQIESKLSGKAGELNIDLSAFTGGAAAFSTLSAAQDARIDIQTAAGTTAYSVTSSSNTFTDVMPGVTFTVTSKPADEVTVSVDRDADALATQVDNLVKAFNTVMFDIKNKSTYNTETKASGPLLGDATTHRAQQELTAAFTDVVAASAAKVTSAAGITVAKDGTLAFDKAKFQTAYQADPAGVQRLFYAKLGDTDPGIAQRLATAAETATSFTTGYLTTSGNQFDKTVASLGKQLTAFESRMKIREVALRRQWNGINVALDKMNSQNSALSTALAGLNASSA